MLKPRLPLSVIEFAEEDLGLELYPVQKVILKLMYGLPLDDETKFVVEGKNRKQGRRMRHTEASYLRYLNEEGRANVKEGVEGGFNETVLVTGRRSGKGLLQAIVASYDILRLIWKDSPQRYFGLPDGSQITVFILALGHDMASVCYNETWSWVQRSGLLRPYMTVNTHSYMKFQTMSDMRDTGHFTKESARSSLMMSFRGPTVSALKGYANFTVILDEFDHSPNQEDLYRILQPSLQCMSPKNGLFPTGPVESKLLMMSSPNIPKGDKSFFQKHYEDGNGLCLSIPTWEMNPTIPASEFDQNAERNPDTFMLEFGADFDGYKPKEKRAQVVAGLFNHLAKESGEVSKVCIQKIACPAPNSVMPSEGPKVAEDAGTHVWVQWYTGVEEYVWVFLPVSLDTMNDCSVQVNRPGTDPIYVRVPEHIAIGWGCAVKEDNPKGGEGQRSAFDEGYMYRSDRAPAGRFQRVQAGAGLFEVPQDDTAPAVCRELVQRAVADGNLPSGEDAIWAKTLLCLGWSVVDYDSRWILNSDYLFSAWGKPGDYRVTLYAPKEGSLVSFHALVERLVSQWKRFFPKVTIEESNGLNDRVTLQVPESRADRLTVGLVRAFNEVAPSDPPMDKPHDFSDIVFFRAQENPGDDLVTVRIPNTCAFQFPSSWLDDCPDEPTDQLATLVRRAQDHGVLPPGEGWDLVVQTLGLEERRRQESGSTKR